MNITPAINQQTSISNIRFNSCPTAKQQITRTNQVSFGSLKAEKALKLLDGTIDTLINGSEFNLVNRLRFHSILDAALPALMVPENFINNGRASKVYRISDNYVAKIKRGYYPKDALHIFDPISLPNKKFQTLDFYYGEPVIKTGKIEILKNATPTSDHICCGTSYRCDGGINQEELKRYETVFLPKCSEVPQESFDNLAENLKKLNKISARSILGKKMGYIPDVINPNNLMISNNRFVLVDELEKVPFKNPNSVYTMLEPILLKLNPEKFADKNNTLKDVRKNILKKILSAAEKHTLPLDSPTKYEYSEWALSNIIGSSNILNDIANMRAQNIPTAERIRNIEEILNKI